MTRSPAAPEAHLRKASRRLRLARAAALLCLVPLLLAGARTAAQFAAEPGQYHWAYAATFGTGLYRLNGDTDVLVVRLPFQWRLHEPDASRACRCGLRLLFPLALGFEDFSFEAAFEGERPERVEQVSLLPGVELEFPRTDRWALRVRVQLGWGTQTSGARDSALIYGTGVRSRYQWSGAPGRPALINGLHWTGFRDAGGGSESMFMLSNGVELDFPVARWRFRNHAMHLMPHVLTDWYAEPLQLPASVEGDRKDVHMEWEVGLAAGRAKPFSILGFEFDRVGVAFRFSDQTQGVRIFAASIF